MLGLTNHRLPGGQLRLVLIGLFRQKGSLTAIRKRGETTVTPKLEITATAGLDRCGPLPARRLTALSYSKSIASERRMRKLFFWLHLSAGVIAGIVIFVMSVTGVLLMYEKQLISWFDQKDLPAVSGSSRLPVETLLTQARTSRGALPAAIALSSDASKPAQLTFGREIVYQDPSNGQILGGGNASARQFFRSVTDWHRWLATGTENRAAGRAATGAANLAFLFIVLSGAYLWIPRVWTAASVRAITLFRGGLSGKARDFNWHNVIGIWCFVPLVLIVASASVISYPWASNLVYTLAGSPVPAAPGGGGGPRGGRGEAAAEVDLAGLDALWSRAAAHTTDWALLTMRLPASGRAPVTL